MQPLWAPWRMEYILEAKEQAQHVCIFCTLPRAQADRENLILWRGRRTFLMLNKFPYNPGHLMVAPYTHTADLDHLAPDELTDLMLNVRWAVRCLGRAMNPDGYNIGINLGRTAGAGIPDHLHYHVVPRWDGDHNFMPVIAETKVIPQHLQRTYDQLAPLFWEEQQMGRP
ncbi:MAG TPA: HIT domain-containing protein [Alphaproteobacteria bacterium]|nr:HIT domain-containing protein [Alphaproteobacteria bacterium]